MIHDNVGCVLARTVFHNTNKPARYREVSAWCVQARTLLVLLIVCEATALAQSADGPFLAGLRERGLHRLASEYCRGRLAEDSLPDARRTELVIELARSLAEWAVASPPSERGPRWGESLDILREDLKIRPENRRAMLLKLQEAMVHLSRGELAREETRLSVEQKLLLEEARTELRAAVRLLSSLNEEVAEKIRSAGTDGPKHEDEGLSPDELASIEKTVRYETARALRNQGECFAAESADRANSATRAIELLDPLTRLDPRDPLCWKSRIDRVACLILAGNYTDAVAGLDALDSQKPPADVALRLRALRMEAALVQGQLSRAVGILSLGRQIEAVVSPRLDYAWLWTCLEAWRAAGQAGEQKAANEWQTKANKMVRLMEKLHGPYWARRAQMLAGKFYGAAGGNQALQTLIYAAESAYRSGQLDDALTAYDRAVTTARAASKAPGDDDSRRAFDLAFTAAMIEQKRGRHDQASTRFRQLALDMPDNAKAPDAHMQAIWNAGQSVKDPHTGPAADPQAAGENKKRHLQHYAMLLDEHSRTWPNSPTAGNTRWMLGRLAQHQADWETAVAAYRSIVPSDERFGQAVRAAGQCYAAWLNELQVKGDPTAAIAGEAANWFESHIVPPQGTANDQWKPTGEEAAIAAARLRLNFMPDGFALAQRILENALTAMPAADTSKPNRRSEAETLLVLSLAGQGRRREASEVLRRISGGGTQELLDTLSRLDELAVRAGSNARRELAGLVLQMVDALRPRLEKLTPAQQRQVDIVAARAMAESARVDEALSLYRRLLAAKPEDIEVHEALARLLARRQDRGSLEAALREWRLIEKGLKKRLAKNESKPDRAAWFATKLEIARLHVRLDNRKQADKMIEVLSILHPDLGGPAMKRQFEKVRAECRAK
ncbi:MAG: bacterial transcriptional activator domain-containing protein [Pirellulales bacterium]|nr:bacterial transcriptional activator domain-containing protein [Pirellulales bacterium]